MRKRLMRAVLFALVGAVVKVVQRKVAQSGQLADDERQRARAPLPANQS